MRRSWLVAGGGAGLLVLLRTGPFRVAVHGSSMLPSVHPGDYLLATRRGHIRREDVVVVRHPHRAVEMLKRVAGIPGDLVHGRRLDPDEYLVVGDNPAHSTDGWVFGPVPRDAVVGVVRFRYWPRPGRVPKGPGGSATREGLS